MLSLSLYGSVISTDVLIGYAGGRVVDASDQAAHVHAREARREVGQAVQKEGYHEEYDALAPRKRERESKRERD